MTTPAKRTRKASGFRRRPETVSCARQRGRIGISVFLEEKGKLGFDAALLKLALSPKKVSFFGPAVYYELL
jgi:hypothetical protein